MHARTHACTHAHACTHTHTHARTDAHTRTHTVSDEGMGRAVKNSLEIVIKQVHLQGGFKRGGRISLRQIVPDRWASIRKRSFTKCFCVYTGGWLRFVCQMQIVIVLLEYKVEGDRTDTDRLFLILYVFGRSAQSFTVICCILPQVTYTHPASFCQNHDCRSIPCKVKLLLSSHSASALCPSHHHFWLPSPSTDKKDTQREREIYKKQKEQYKKQKEQSNNFNILYSYLCISKFRTVKDCESISDTP